MIRTVMGRSAGAAALGIAALLCAGGALAQAQKEVARLKQVNGNVLVSGQTGLATGNEAQPLVNGTRIITTSKSRAIVVFENGCEVRLEENQRFDVESDKPCAALVPHSLAAAPASPPGLSALVIPLLIGAGGGADVINRTGVGVVGTTSVSPN
jgi:hypothetical protein